MNFVFCFAPFVFLPSIVLTSLFRMFYVTCPGGGTAIYGLYRYVPLWRVYSPRNDPDPEMIPNPEMIPKLTPKWSRPRNDPHFSSCRPRNDSQGIREWWLNMRLWIAFLFFVEMLQSCHFFSFLRSFKRKETSCRVTLSFQSRSSLVPVDLWPI